MRIKFCPYTIFLIFIFSIFFLHTIFILNEDHILISSYELGDAGNFAHAIMRLFNDPVYNHHNYFFGSNHGWIFSDISFFVILILKFFGQIFGLYEPSIFGFVDDQPFFNGVIRTINFAFALSSVLLFFKLSNFLFENKKVSFIASLCFMFLPWAAIYSYWLKPDATGMFFILVSILYLVKFVKQESKPIYFYIAFISLELATFSKIYYGFFIFPVFFLFFLNYCDKRGVNYLRFLFSKVFFKILMPLPFIYLLIILIIHPYSIFDFGGGVNGSYWIFMPWDVFIGMFKSISSSASNILSSNVNESKPVGISFSASFYKWMIFYKQEPLIYLNTLLVYLLLIPLFFRKRFSVSWLFVISVIFCNLYLLVVVYGSRKMFDLRYIYPIAPLLILNLVAFLLFVWNKLNSLSLNKSYYLKILFAGLGILFIIPFFAENVLVTTNSLLARAAYKQSTLYQTRQFLLDNTSTFSQRKMLVDLGTAPVPPKATWLEPHAEMSWVPSKMINPEKFKDYINPNAQVVWVSWESQSQSLKFIKDNNISPQFLILGEWRYNAYRQYIAKNHFRMIKTFQANNTELASLSYWFPYYENTQLKSFNTTLKLIELHRNPNLIIGSTIVFYRN